LNTRLRDCLLATLFKLARYGGLASLRDTLLKLDRRFVAG
jgi:hypothetical protein